MSATTVDMEGEQRCARAIEEVCRADVQALKPGNVSVYSAGHGMTADDFLRSAVAIAGPMCTPGLGVGERILAGVEATRKVVSCNTNLGIILLAAPLLSALCHRRTNETLRVALQRILTGLDRKDAQLAFRAIRLAQPGGLGHSDRHDVSEEQPAATLLEAMQAASDRDGIALQYANGFADVFDFGAPRVATACRRWNSLEWAMVSGYLGFLARMPDTLVARKHGRVAAQQLQSQAAPWDAGLLAAADPGAWLPQLARWDLRLKNDRINPGTSADLTVASVLAWRLEGMPHPN